MIFLRTVVAATFLSLLSSSPMMAATTFYYSGTARVLDLNSGVQSTEDVFLKKTLSPESEMITEVGCVLRAGQQPSLSPVYMKVAGEKIIAMSNSPIFSGGNLSGKGELQGENWKWSYLKFTMFWEFDGGHKVRIEDVNFVVTDHLVARKQLFYDERPIQLWDIEMKVMDEQTFVESTANAHCPNF